MPKKTGWKAQQSRQQVARKTKLALIALAVILGVILLAQAVRFTHSLFSPWKLSSSKQFLWNDQYNLNFIVKTKGIALVSFDPSQDKITIIDLPASTFIDTAHGFGQWQLGSVYDLGQSSALSGSRLLELSLTNFFGLPIEGMMDFSGKPAELTSQGIVDMLRKNPLSVLDLLPNVKSDFTPFELLRIKMALAGVRYDGISEIDLSQTGALDMSKLADGTTVYVADPQKMDSLLSVLADPKIKNEHQTIAVFNATDHSQLGSKVARLINNLGGNVIIVANFDSKIKQTIVTGNKSQTLDRLKQIFGKNDNIALTLNDQILARAQINVFLGEDYFQNQ